MTALDPDAAAVAAPPRHAVADDDVRAAIRDDLDRTLFVEAGAGTGKTTALVGRLVSLVVNRGVDLREVAAITFTEAAAGELRDRTREALELVAAGEVVVAATDDDPADTALAAERAARARRALDDVDGSVIGTLHGFAQRILAAHPFEAGLPPVFEVLDEAQSAVAFDARWSDFVDRLLATPEHEQALTRALVCGITLVQLRNVALELDRNWDLVADHPFDLPTPGPIDAGPVIDLLTEAVAGTAWCLDPTDMLVRHVESLGDHLGRLRAARTELETLQLIAEAPRLASAKGRKGNWDGRVDELRDLLAQAQSQRDLVLRGAMTAALRHLLVAVREVTLDGARERQLAGRLEFHDLLVLSRDLLRHHPEVARQVGGQLRHLLIDEFQDTDPIQVELAVRIATEDPDAAGTPWQELSVPPGRLFFVGDPKQAIYRFRRADLALFTRVRDDVVGEAVRLTRNRRSVPGILAWVDAMFAELLGEGVAGAQAAHEPLLAHRAAAAAAPFADRPPVVVLGAAMPEARNVDAVRSVEARELAAAIAVVRDEGWPVGDDGRPARLADIAVLLPTRTSLPPLQEALDAAGIPFRVESSSLVYSTNEVQDLLNTLRAIDDPTDAISVVAALRSPLFGCGDDDLVEHHAHGGRWDYRREPPEGLGADHPVVAGLAALAELHRERWWHDVSGLIERVLAERRMLELALDDRRPREVWRRLRFVVDHARLFAETAGRDLRAYLAWVDLQRAEDAKVVEAILPETDDDAVRVMTVHASKGLEFPVVVLAGLNVLDRFGGGVQVLWGPDGPEVSLTAARRTEGFSQLAVRESELDGYEAIRLLYVGATRARDHLVVSLHHKPSARPNCHAARLEPVCAAHPDLWRRLDLNLDLDLDRDPEAGQAVDRDGGLAPVAEASPTELASGQLVLDFDAAPVDDERARWQAARAALLASSAPTTITATGIARIARTATTEPVRSGDASESDESPWRRGRAGTNLGRAVHATLQAVDLSTGADLAGIAVAQAVAEGVAPLASRVEALARAALDAPELQAAIAGGRWWRELPLAAPIEGRLVEGVIDLLAEGPDGFIVIDHKTDPVPDAHLDAAVARHRPQLATYALLVEAALGRPVTQATFLFLHDTGARARTLTTPDLTAAKAAVRTLLHP